LQQFATGYQQGQGLIPSFTMTHTMPNYNQTTTSQTGFYDDTTGQFQAGTGAAPGTSLRTTGQGNTTINVSVSGVVGNASDVATAISGTLRQLNNGQAPGGYGAVGRTNFLRSAR
jgi:hypothetical protein